jgi:hypothetical protein
MRTREGQARDCPRGQRRPQTLPCPPPFDRSTRSSGAVTTRARPRPVRASFFAPSGAAGARTPTPRPHLKIPSTSYHGLGFALRRLLQPATVCVPKPASVTRASYHSFWAPLCMDCRIFLRRPSPPGAARPAPRGALLFAVAGCGARARAPNPSAQRRPPRGAGPVGIPRGAAAQRVIYPGAQ